MLANTIGFLVPLLAGALAAAALVAVAWFAARRALRRAQAEAERIREEARQDARREQRAMLLAAEEKTLALSEETDLRERELEERESRLETRLREQQAQGSEQERRARDLRRRDQALGEREQATAERERAARAMHDEAQGTLTRIAGLSEEQARAELIAGIEEDARAEGARLARRIEDQAREGAEREATNLVIRSTARIDLSGVTNSSVTFIQLPDDDMKGRIIGREGRNIRALETATGIDLIIDDTPGAILVSCFDPLRRELARIVIERLVEDGRIHPARIEEVVERVREELDELVALEGNQAAFQLGLSELHPRLARLVGRMKFHAQHGQGLLQHCLETALLAGHMASETGARVELTHRAGLLHEIARVDGSASGHSALASAELAAKFGESGTVAGAIRALHPDVEFTSLEGILLDTANRVSDNRPGARKDNLEIFIERLRRLEALAQEFDGVEQAYAVKAGKELRVIVDAAAVSDDGSYALSKQIAKRVEEEVVYPGQVKVSVLRETRAVRYAV